MKEYIEYSEEVLFALQNSKPVIAIETGGTFAGIPYPDNVETAKKVCKEVKKAATSTRAPTRDSTARRASPSGRRASSWTASARTAAVR